jgi:glucose-6-phosphate dehydrogenase assembly protein OpcA
MAAAVQPERIVRDLAELWASLAKAGSPENPAASGVLRACAMTLIVAADDAADAANVGQTVGELMHEHPSRAIVLKPAEAGAELDARVFAQCWMPFGSRQQICCEEIEITTPEQSLDEVSRTILGLLAPDLPAVLWCRGQSWFERSGFERLYPLIDKIVVDSCSFRDASRVFPTLRALRRGKARVADLSWARLTMWREAIANTFEACEGRDLGAVRSIEVRHYGEAPSAAAYYLAAWLTRAFANAAFQFRSMPGEGQVAGVKVQGDGVDIELQRLERDTVQVSGSASLNAIILPHASDTRSMSEELTITGTDVVFEEVFARAEQLAQSRRS